MHRLGERYSPGRASARGSGDLRIAIPERLKKRRICEFWGTREMSFPLGAPSQLSSQGRKTRWSVKSSLRRRGRRAGRLFPVSCDGL